MTERQKEIYLILLMCGREDEANEYQMKCEEENKNAEAGK